MIKQFSILVIAIIFFFLLIITCSCSKEDVFVLSQVGSWEVAQTKIRYSDTTLVYQFENDFDLELLENGLGIKTSFSVVDSLVNQDSLTWCWHEYNNAITIIYNYDSTLPLINTFHIVSEDSNNQSWEQEIAFEETNGTYRRTITQWFLKKK